MPETVVYAVLLAAGLAGCLRLRLRPDAWSVALGVALAAFQAVGHCYREHGTWRAIFSLPSESAHAAVAMTVGAAGLALLCRLAFHAMDRAGEVSAARREPVPWPPTPVVALALLAAWLPYLVVFAPGSLTFDGTNQLDVFYGFLPRTDHHPYLMTLLMGSVFDLGRRLGSDGLGVALWVCLQSVAQAAALSLSVASMRRQGAPRGALAASALFFALAPAWGAYAQAFLKDTLFASLLCLHVTLLLELLSAPRRGEPRGALALALLASSAALCLARHNGAHVVALSLAPLLVALPRGRRALAAAAAGGALALWLAWSSLALPTLGVSPGGRQEALGSLFQMTARYLREAPDDVEPWEREAVSAVLDCDSLAALYDPTTSDPVKATYTGDDAALDAYLRAWASMGLRHPGVYLDALLAGSYGYLYVDTSCPHHTWDYRLYTQGDLPGVPDDIEVSYLMPEGVRALAISALNAFQGLPVLGLLGHCGVYSWAALLAAAHSLRARSAAGLAVCAPSIVMLLVCLVSPVNGYLRYMLPVMAAAPVTLWASCRLGSRPRPMHMAGAGALRRKGGPTRVLSLM